MKTANAQIVESTPAPAGLSVVPELEVSWDRARWLWAQATLGAESIIELSFVLVGLRKEFFNQGARADLTSSARGGSSEKGWEKTVEAELGIKQQSARRLMEKGDSLYRLQCIANGEAVEWKDSKGEMRTTEPNEEIQRLAAEAIPDVVAGLKNGGRAWAGVSGEGARAGMDKRRAPVDYAVVMLRAMRSVKASMKQWPDLPPDDRYDVEEAWLDLLKVVPQEFLSAMKKGGK